MPAALLLAVALLAPVRVQIDATLVLAFIGAIERTHETGMEEFYCLMGPPPKDHFYDVTQVVKPRQAPFILDFHWFTYWIVMHAQCPPGTIADLHTHPKGLGAPSDIDYRSALLETDYDLHIIAFQFDSTRSGFRAYESPGSKVLHVQNPDWLKVIIRAY